MSILQKKVILFIVEGPTDKESLGLILNKIIDNHVVKFHIIDGDICTNNSVNSQNAPAKIWEEVKYFIDKNRYQRCDINRIVHLVDTDGTYVPSEVVVEADVEEPCYFEDHIETKNCNSIIRRNFRKSNVVSRLCAVAQINKIPYIMYYFSSNLEHVLHNIQKTLSSAEKMDLAEKFVDRFENCPFEFIVYISDPTFAVQGNYLESWEYLKSGLHSLQRKCNFHLFFK